MSAKGKLPEDFPHRTQLEAAGVTTDGEAEDGDDAEGLDTSHEAQVNAVTNEDRDGTGPTDAPIAPEGSKAAMLTGREPDKPSAAEKEARQDAANPGQKQTKDETLGEKLQHSRFCSYDDPVNPFIGNADEVVKRNERVKVLPIALTTPSKGMEIRDGNDIYQITEEMAGERPDDWLKVRSPKTGLALIR